MAVTPATLHPAAQRLYDNVAHLEVADPETGYDPQSEGWPLATLCAALAKPVEVLWDTLMEGMRPWEPLFDLDRTRDELLPYLGNYAGVRFPPNVPLDRSRLRLQRIAAQSRGTLPAIKAEVQQFLPDPDARVDIFERVGDEDHMTIVTYVAQTPADAEAMIRQRLESDEVVPGGLIWTYEVRGGQTYAEAEALYATYADAEAAFATYSDAESVIP
jgi:hypothetical protein